MDAVRVPDLAAHLAAPVRRWGLLLDRADTGAAAVRTSWRGLDERVSHDAPPRYTSTTSRETEWNVV